MRVYFVRHGQTEANISGTIQGPETPLSAKGVRQSQRLAKRFMAIPIDAIIASSYVRTSETAHIVSLATEKPVEKSDMLVELAHPSLWKFDEGTEFADYKLRARKALDEIQARKENSLLVVTHGNFMKLMMGTLLEGESLTPELFMKIYNLFLIHNTGIVTCDYENGAWKIVSVNEHTHLEYDLE